MPTTSTSKVTITSSYSWLGWALAGAFGIIIIFLLMRGTGATQPYTADLAKIDSLQKENAILLGQASRKDSIIAANQIAAQSNLDSLQLMDQVHKAQIKAASAENLSLAKQVKYYKHHRDTVSYDSACDLLAERVPVQDSIIHAQQVNSDSLTASLSRVIVNLDSAHNADLSLIASDRKVISAQSDLIKKTTAADKASTKRSKFNKALARIGGGGAAGAGIAAVVLGSNPIGLTAIGLGTLVFILAK
jgi:hypothetical protein